MDKTFKGIIVLIIITFFVLLVFLSNVDLSIEEKVVNNDTNFIVGFEKDNVPYSYAENIKYGGFDLELAEEVAKRNNWTLVQEPIVWSEKEEKINSGEVDCVWSSFTIEGRENDYEWSEPYVVNKVVAVVKTDSDINSLADLKDKKVEYLADSSTEDKLNSVNKSFASTFASKNPIRTNGMGIVDLYSTGADVFLSDEATMTYYILHSNGQLRTLDEVFSYEHFGVGFKKGNTELRDQVQATLDEMARDGTIAKIAMKYDDYGISENICI